MTYDVFGGCTRKNGDKEDLGIKNKTIRGHLKVIEKYEMFYFGLRSGTVR